MAQFEQKPKRCGKRRERVFGSFPMKTSGWGHPVVDIEGDATWLVYMTPLFPVTPQLLSEGHHLHILGVIRSLWNPGVGARVLTQSLGGGSPVELGEANTWVLTR